jgi:hypothetical protein
MIYEWRTYVAVPGKMALLHQRFREVTLGFFKKYDIEVVGFFEEAIGDNQRLHYILRFPDLGERERRWNAFQSDPEWIRAKQATEVDGPLSERIENRMMRLTDYSPEV